MLLHQGTLHLSRATPPLASWSLDGVFTLTLLAIDRSTDTPQPYLLIWPGERARSFWQLHSTKLTERAELRVELTQLRLHTHSDQPKVTHLLADVISLQVLPKAVNLHHKKPSSLCVD